MKAAALLLLLPFVLPGASKEIASAKAVEEVAAITIPISFTMEPQQTRQVQPSGRDGYYIPVQPQPYKRKCGTIATDVCKVDVTIPDGATGEQVYQMAAEAEQQGRKGEAASYLDKAAEMGYAKAQAAVGKNYANGNGEQRDSEKAAFWLGKAAAQGNRGAQYTLGAMYEKGDGVPQNQAYALRYYQASAAQHDSNAEFALGLDYEFGLGVAHNRTAAIRYLRQSSVDGYDADGAHLASVLTKTPASKQFHNFDEISAYLHPAPPPGKPGSCPSFAVLLTGPRAQAQIGVFCGCHPGCPYSSPGFPNMSCSNAGARPYCNGSY